MGNAQEVKVLDAHHTRKYDLTKNTFGPTVTTISK